MKPRRSVPRHQVMSVAVLILLAVLTALLWFADPAHRPSGGSRIGWPSPGTAKP